MDLNKQYKKIKNKILLDFSNTLEDGDYILGKKVYELESKLAEFVGVKECVSCASGTDALLIPLMSKDIGLGDAVFTTNFSFFATAEVISIVGATPIFVDIKKNTYNINPELLETQIKNTLKEGKLKPKAIIAVDLFGQLAQYDKIEKIAKKYNLLLIEDACQSFGASIKEKKSGSFGHVAGTSFYPAKPLGCYGDGGAIFTNNSIDAENYRSIRVHGQGMNKYDNVRIGLNSRLDTIQALVLLRKIEIFDEELELRENISKYYNENLDGIVEIPKLEHNYKSSWAQYSILAKNEKERSELVSYLSENNIPSVIYYKKPFNTLDIYKKISNSKFPVSETVSKTILSLPMHPYLSIEDQKKIIKLIHKFYK